MSHPIQIGLNGKEWARINKIIELIVKYSQCWMLNELIECTQRYEGPVHEKKVDYFNLIAGIETYENAMPIRGGSIIPTIFQ